MTLVQNPNTLPKARNRPIVHNSNNSVLNKDKTEGKKGYETTRQGERRGTACHLCVALSSRHQQKETQKKENATLIASIRCQPKDGTKGKKKNEKQVYKQEKRDHNKGKKT